MKENKIYGYEKAIELTDKGSRTIWSVYSALLALNAFLLTFATFFAPKISQTTIMTIIVCIVGILICISWLLITMRNFDFYKYYFSYARRFEKEAFGDQVDMIRNGKEFAEGNKVKSLEYPIRMRWGSRLFKVEWMIYTVIFSFILIYTFILYQQL